MADNSGSNSFNRVERVGEENARSFFVFATSIRNYTIRHDGHGESYSAKVLRRNFDLRMGPNSRLERLYYLEYEGDLLLVYEVTDQRSDWAYVMRMDQNTRKTIWLTPLSGFRIGPGLVDNGSAYISAANLLTRINLRTGKIEWQQSEIEQQRPPFTGFALPSIEGARVVFTEDEEDGRIVEIEKDSGKLLNVKRANATVRN